MGGSRAVEAPGLHRLLRGGGNWRQLEALEALVRWGWRWLERRLRACDGMRSSCGRRSRFQDLLGQITVACLGPRDGSASPLWPRSA